MSTTDLRGARDFLGAELGAVARRPRNLALLAVLAALPVLLGVAAHGDRNLTIDGGDGVRIEHGAASGVHFALAGLLVTMPLLLPLMVAMVAGESVAGEAQAGTLRYLLTVPVGRTRLLFTKYATATGWSLLVTAVAAGSGAVTGFALFPAGRVTLLSGHSVPVLDGIGRLALATLYVGVMLAAFAAIGVFVSTLTDAPLVAMGATLGVAVIGQVLESLPSLHAVWPWLPTHYWSRFLDVLSSAPLNDRLLTGLLAQAAFAAVFLALAWAQFAGRDITS
jgi:ABC-2 type transport system permease protein